MISKRIQGKGILSKLLEQGIKYLIMKECKKISNLKIEIIGSSIQIIKGDIQKINIVANDINYKDLLFDEIELETNQIKINFLSRNKELKLNNNFKIKFKLSLSENSVKTILLSDKWNWIGNMISKEILNQAKLEDIVLKDGQFLIKASKDINTINKLEQLNLKVEQGKIYLKSKAYNSSIKIPTEDKVYIKDAKIENNSIIISADSSVSF